MGDVATIAASHTKCKSMAIESDDGGIPLKDDPSFGKYFKMLKMGLSVDAVKHTLIRDGQDPKVLDLDPEKSLEFQNQQNMPAKEATFMLGGITAMAAAASSKKEDVKSSNSVLTTPLLREIASSAAAPVSKWKIGTDEGKIEGNGLQNAAMEITSPLANTRGIAAMATAAEAAREKLISRAVEGIGPNSATDSITMATTGRNDLSGQVDCEKDGSAHRRGLNPRGIAAMAAASAVKLKNGSKSIVGNAITAAGDSGVLNRFTGLGIVHEATSSHVGLSIGSACSGGGIAAMAAAAAAKRNRATQQNGTTEDIASPTLISGGATMAIHSRVKTWKHQETSPPEVKAGINPFAGGGIAAAAAKAAAKRNNSKQYSEKTASSGSVIRNLEGASQSQGNCEPVGKVFINPIMSGGDVAAATASVAQHNRATQIPGESSDPTMLTGNDSSRYHDRNSLEEEVAVKNSFVGEKSVVDNFASGTETVSMAVAVGTEWERPDEPNDDQSLRAAYCPSSTGEILLEAIGGSPSISDTTRRYMEKTSASARIKVVSAKDDVVSDGSIQAAHELDLVGSRIQVVEDFNDFTQNENHGIASVAAEPLLSTSKAAVGDTSMEGTTAKLVGKAVHVLGMVDVCNFEKSMDERFSTSFDAVVDETLCLEKVSMGEALQIDEMVQEGRLGQSNDEIAGRGTTLREESFENSREQKYEGENGFQKWFGKLGMKEEHNSAPDSSMVNQNNYPTSPVKRPSQEGNGFSSFFRQFSVKSNLGDEAAPAPAMEKP